MRRKAGPSGGGPLGASRAPRPPWGRRHNWGADQNPELLSTPFAFSSRPRRSLAHGSHFRLAFALCYGFKGGGSVRRMDATAFLAGFGACVLVGGAAWGLLASFQRGTRPPGPPSEAALPPSFIESAFQALRSELQAALNEVRSDQTRLRQEWASELELMNQERERANAAKARAAQAQRQLEESRGGAPPTPNEAPAAAVRSISPREERKMIERGIR